MIDFACKQFNLDDIIKCGLGLTKAEFKVMEYFIHNSTNQCTTESVSKKLKLNLTTIQKAVKKLSEKNILMKYQENLEKGGYVFTYECNSKKKIRDTIKKIIQNWTKKVEEKIDRW